MQGLKLGYVLKNASHSLQLNGISKNLWLNIWGGVNSTQYGEQSKGIGTESRAASSILNFQEFQSTSS